MKSGISIELIPAKKIRNEIGNAIFESLPIYNLPEFLNITSGGNGWFAKMEIDGFPSAFFPFTGDKLLWNWRIYQTPFCQKLTPFCIESEVNEQQWKAWFEWLRTKTWTCFWAHSFFCHEPEITLKRNQFFSLNQDSNTILTNWKGNRKAALTKTKDLVVKYLTHEDFFINLILMRKQTDRSLWKLNEKERKILNQISELELNKLKISRFGIFSGNQCIALVLITFWSGRYYFLYSFSSPFGFQKEAVTFFLRHFIENHSPKPAIFDFEGSNLDGVSRFFRSFGAEEEAYGLFQI